MEQIPVGTVNRVKYNGPFDTQTWYRKLFDIFTTMGYRVDEKTYREVHSPTGESKDIFAAWECRKHPKGDTYCQFLITIDINIVGVKKVKVVKNGEEVSTDSGDNDCYYNAYLVLDPKDRWQKSSFLRYLRYFYDKFFYRSKIEFYKNLCWEELYTITGEVKSFFNLSRFI